MIQKDHVQKLYQCGKDSYHKTTTRTEYTNIRKILIQATQHEDLGTKFNPVQQRYNSTINDNEIYIGTKSTRVHGHRWYKNKWYNRDTMSVI